MKVVSTRSQSNHPLRAGFSPIGKSNLCGNCANTPIQMDVATRKNCNSMQGNPIVQLIFFIFFFDRKFNKKSKYPSNSDCTWSLHVGESNYAI